MEIEREILKGYVDIIVLSLLFKQDRYGYEIVKYLRDITQGAFDLKEATVYFCLKRLEKNKDVSSYWGDVDSSGGRRKYYNISTSGIKRLRGKKVEWELLKKQIDFFLGGIENDN